MGRYIVKGNPGTFRFRFHSSLISAGLQTNRFIVLASHVVATTLSRSSTNTYLEPSPGCCWLITPPMSRLVDWIRSLRGRDGIRIPGALKSERRWGAAYLQRDKLIENAG